MKEATEDNDQPSRGESDQCALYDFATFRAHAALQSYAKDDFIYLCKCT